MAAGQIRNRRRDGLYIFVALFAGVGGLFLLGSYANSAPIATFNKGSYSLAEYKTDVAGEYKLGLNSKLQYCIAPMETSGAWSITLKSASGSASSPEVIEPIQFGNKTACFKTKANYDSVTVTVTPLPISSATLTVK